MKASSLLRFIFAGAVALFSMLLGSAQNTLCNRDSLSARDFRDMALRGFDILADTAASAPDIIRGLQLTRIAAEANDPVALNNLGYLADSGKFSRMPGLEADSIVALNPERAARFYIAAMRHKMTSAAINLLNLTSRHPELDLPADDVSQAHMLVARAYALGNSVLPYDYQESLNHFLEAARLGNPEAIRVIKETLEMFPDAFPPDMVSGIKGLTN